MGGAGEEKIEGPSAGPSAHGTEVQASEWKCGCRPLPPEREGDLPDQVGHAVGLACCARLCLPEAGGVKPQIRGSRS